MLEGYSVINEESREGTLATSGFDVGFENICANGNIAILIISADGSIIRASVNDTRALKNQFMDAIFGDPSETSTELLEKTNSYVLEKQVDSD